MSTAQAKQPSFYREPIIPELVIPDLQDLERKGSYDRNVLLWLQDGYVNRAIKENVAQLRDLHTSLVESGESPETMRREKTGALIAFTRATYANEKAEGRGADLKGYLDAAKTFFEAESARYGGHLQELAEYIKKALENGEKPDIERHARHVYVSMAKLSGAMIHLEGLSGKPAALQIAHMMRKRRDEIKYVTIADQPTNVGRKLMEVVERIGENPRAYIEFRDPDRLGMPERGPWDYEPMQRQGEYTHRF